MRIAIFCGLLFLAACTGVPVQPPAADPQAVWKNRQEQLAGIRNWALVGRIAIHAGEESWQAKIDWQQHREKYRIDLLGPLGHGSLRLEGDAGGVRLSDGEQVRVATDAGTLLYKELGWRVPVADLRYWVLGLPAAGPADVEINAQGYLAKLEQAGWSMEFSKYAGYEGVVLPGRLFIHNHQARIRLVVDRWELLTGP